MGAAALPGHTLVVLDPQLMLVIDAFPCEDGHAQERSLLGQVEATVQPRISGSTTAISAPRASCSGLPAGKASSLSASTPRR